MIKELWEFVNYWITTEELVLAGIGLIFIVIIFILGNKKQEKEKGE